MGVHHAWGRTLKDVFQRYKALRGHELRYQNGFDCQGLWVEVEVEKSLGLNSKREIEEYGLAEFAARCRERVATFAEVITDQSRRLGMWMDWDNDYYTFSDTNIEYIWRFLKEVHRARLARSRATARPSGARAAAPRSRSTSRRARATTRSSTTRRSTLRFPLSGRPEALVVWTTTPWTLPANVAAAVKPDADYGLFGDEWWAVARRPDETPSRTVRGSRSSSASNTRARSTTCPRRRESSHRVIPWDDVTLDEGTGIVHIAPGCGAEDFELSRVLDLPVIAPINEDGRFYPGFGALEGRSTAEVEEPVVEQLRERGLLVDAGRIDAPLPDLLAVPDAARLPRRRRLVHRRRRRSAQALLAENQAVEWTPSAVPQAHGRLAAQHGRLEHLAQALLRPAAALLSVRLRAPERDRLARRAGRAGRPWARPARGAAPAVDRRGSDSLRGRAARRCERIPEVGDAWLDAGIVPFSTLGWQNADVGRARIRDRSGRGADRRRPTGPRVLGAVVPGRLGLGDARADPPLVLLPVLHVGDARRPLAVPARAHVREAARRDTAARCTARGATRSTRTRRSTGWAPTSCAGCSARCRRRRTSSSATGRRTRSSGGCSRSGTRPRSSSPTRTSRASGRSTSDLAQGPPAGQPLDAWLVARTRQLVAEAGERLRALLDAGGHPRVRGLRRRSLELVHPPLAAPLLLLRRAGVPDALVRARPGAARDRAADAVPRRRAVAEPRRRRLRGRARLGPPRRLAGGRRARPRRCSPRSRRCARSSSSAARSGPRRASSCASRSAARGWRGRTRSRDHLDEIRAGAARARASSCVDGAPVLASPTSRTCRCSGRGSAPALPAVRAALEAGRVRGARRRPHPRRRPRARRAASCSSSGSRERGWAHSDRFSVRPRPRARRGARASRAACST